MHFYITFRIDFLKTKNDIWNYRMIFNQLVFIVRIIQLAVQNQVTD